MTMLMNNRAQMAAEWVNWGLDPSSHHYSDPGMIQTSAGELYEYTDFSLLSKLSLKWFEAEGLLARLCRPQLCQDTWVVPGKKHGSKGPSLWRPNIWVCLVGSQNKWCEEPMVGLFATLEFWSLVLKVRTFSVSCKSSELSYWNQNENVP